MNIWIYLLALFFTTNKIRKQGVEAFSADSPLTAARRRLIDGDDDYDKRHVKYIFSTNM